MKRAIKSIVKFYSFKEWQRKSYSVFNSLSKVIKICVLLTTYSLLMRNILHASQVDTTEPMTSKQIAEVEIIGQRSPGFFPFSIRSIDLIDKNEIFSSTALSVDKLLDFHSGIDIRHRGPWGVQSDISIRGGSFDHSLVMINGINITDPQTGHLNLDLFLDPDYIKSVEILKGSASRIYGSNAFTGIINFTTSPENRNYFKIKGFYGSYNLKNYIISTNFKIKNSFHFVNYSNKLSDGYIKNTDFNVHNFYHHSVFSILDSKIDFQTGYQDKKFGANSFYSPKYPDQYEEGNVYFSSLKITTGFTVKFISSAYWRRKFDHYVLVRTNPQLYQNFHLTDIYGSQFNLSFNNALGKTSVGCNLRNESILSNRLGYSIPTPVKVSGFDSVFYTKKFNRTITDIFLEHSYRYDNLIVVGGFLINHTSDYPYKYRFFPGLDLNYELLYNLKFNFSWNYSVHLPTFTDLFYIDPSNQGNLLLNPARLNSFEININYKLRKFNGLFTLFYQQGNDVIEWLWSWNSMKYSPVNLNNYMSKGIELSGQITNLFKFNYIKIDYTFLDIVKSTNDNSILKYNNARNKITINVNYNIVKNNLLTSSCTFGFKFIDREGNYLLYDFNESKYYQEKYKPYEVFDFKVDISIKKATFYLLISNILNRKYVELGSVEQPGRWINLGFQYVF